MNNLPNKLVQSGFTPDQARNIMGLMVAKPDVAKIGIADAETNAEAIKLANACKHRLNDLIEALKK